MQELRSVFLLVIQDLLVNAIHKNIAFIKTLLPMLQVLE